VSLALTLALGSAAMAADMPVKARPVMTPVPYSWTGCYVGGHVGGLWGRTEHSSDFANNAVFTPNQDVTFSSFTGGGQIGCNYQIASGFVFGIEADLSGAKADKYGILDQFEGEQILRTKFDWYGSVRGRLGYGMDRTLLYVTGGLAFGEVVSSYENYIDATLLQLEPPGGAIPFDSAKRTFGWVIGAGAEYALTDNLIVRGEYLYYNFGTARTFDPGPVFVDSRTDFHVARVGLSYKFGGPSAIVARY
jgi:outer membrane immunogenic protein